MIGISAATEPARWGAWNQLADLAPHDYALTVQRAGGVAVLLPADPVVAGDPAPLLDRFDGLILGGGADVDPASYGAEAAAQTTDIRPERDEFELALVKGALEKDLPLLGICRGFQLMNVAAGGTLVQHLPDAVGHERHRTVPGQFDEHEVELISGSRIAGICGSERVLVQSHHHQGLDRIADGLEVTGAAIPDRIAEAIEIPDKSFALGVQWHPEVDEGDSLIAALVDAARARMGA
ncbi:MAG: gamma-glutamyl-gamma-aminobutyrate hydrolase family protein [Thermoleophilia bacterium]|nr:gamma-glutamyl-gamma-aminobutyrate hydrolase family protein [Thermoleophilia bacterium]